MQKNATLRGIPVVVTSEPRRIAGGEVVTVEWAQDSTDPSVQLPDGSVHPAHRKGFSWEEPVANLAFA